MEQFLVNGGFKRIVNCHDWSRVQEDCSWCWWIRIFFMMIEYISMLKMWFMCFYHSWGICFPKWAKIRCSYVFLWCQSIFWVISIWFPNGPNPQRSGPSTRLATAIAMALSQILMTVHRAHSRPGVVQAKPTVPNSSKFGILYQYLQVFREILPIYQAKQRISTAMAS